MKKDAFYTNIAINLRIDFFVLLYAWVGVLIIKGRDLKHKACKHGEMIGKYCLLACIILIPFLITKIAV